MRCLAAGLVSFWFLVTVAPRNAALAPGVERSSPKTMEVRLDRQLGLRSGIVLRGPNSSQVVTFSMPHERRVLSGSAELVVHFAPGLIAGSTVAALINDTPIVSTQLQNQGPAAEVRLRGVIPAAILQDYNRLELRAELHDSAARCESPSDPALWAIVDGASLLSFEIGEYLNSPTLEDFPVPLANPLDYRTAHLRFVLGPHHSSTDYTVAGRIAGALGRSVSRTVQVSAAATFDPKFDGSQVLIGTPTELAEVTKTPVLPLDPGKGRIRYLPGSGEGVVMLIEGEDAAVRIQTVARWIPLSEGGRSPGVLPVADEFSLHDIPMLVSHDTNGPGITVHGTAPQPIFVTLRPEAGEHFVRGEQRLHLKFAYSPQVDAGSSALEVRLNDKSIAGQALRNPAGSPNDSLDVVLPDGSMGSDNQLELRFHLYPKGGLSCTTSPLSSSADQLWATFLSNSTFHLPRDSYVDLPDLGVLRGASPLRENREIWIVSPGDATLFLNAALLFGRLSRTTNAEVRFAQEFTDELRRDANVIQLSASPKLTIAESISLWNPQRLLLTIEGTADNASLLQDPRFVASLAGAKIAMDSAGRVRVTAATTTSRFGSIAFQRRVKYAVMDNTGWFIFGCVALLIGLFFSARFIRRHYFHPLPEVDAGD